MNFLKAISFPQSAEWRSLDFEWKIDLLKTHNISDGN